MGRGRARCRTRTDGALYLYDVADRHGNAVDGRETRAEQPVRHLEADLVGVERHLVVVYQRRDRRRGRYRGRRLGLLLGEHLLVARRRRQEVVVLLKRKADGRQCGRNSRPM